MSSKDYTSITDTEADEMMELAERDAMRVVGQVRAKGKNALSTVELLDTYRLAITEALEEEAHKLFNTQEYADLFELADERDGAAIH
jgi:hypothetical protein